MNSTLLEQKPIVDKLLKENPGYLSSSSFTSIFTWKDFFHFEFKFIDENLCIFAHDDMGCFLYLPPMGKSLKRDTIIKCFLHMEAVNGKEGISRIENVSRQMLESFSKDEFVSYKRGFEYCYFREDIVFLKGNDFKSKRTLYNYFVKNYSYNYVPFDKSMLNDCLKLYDTWSKARLQQCCDPVYAQMIEENRAVNKLVFQFCDQLNIVGRVVQVDGEIKAYTFGYKISDDHFCVLLEVADLGVKGLPVYIFKTFCEDEEVVRYKFINVMDDFELENVKKTKMSFHPRVLEPVYTITKKRGLAVSDGKNR